MISSAVSVGRNVAPVEEAAPARAAFTLSTTSVNSISSVVISFHFLFNLGFRPHSYLLNVLITSPLNRPCPETRLVGGRTLLHQSFSLVLFHQQQATYVPPLLLGLR